jgi:hypothetical protein
MSDPQCHIWKAMRYQWASVNTVFKHFGFIVENIMTNVHEIFISLMNM